MPNNQVSRVENAVVFANAYNAAFPDAKQMPLSHAEMQEELAKATVSVDKAQALAALKTAFAAISTDAYQLAFGMYNFQLLLGRDERPASGRNWQKAAELNGRGDPTAIFRGYDYQSDSEVEKRLLALRSILPFTPGHEHRSHRDLPSQRTNIDPAASSEGATTGEQTQRGKKPMR